MINPMISKIEQTLTHYKPWQLSDHYSSDQQAGVMMLITDLTVPEVILTLRHSKLSSHAGEVAFPGGRRDPEDSDILATALRETHEELGIEPDLVRPLGALSDVLSKHRLKVVPWVGVVPPEVVEQPNPDEIEAVFRVPLSFFMEPGRARFDLFTDVSGKTRYAPAWDYQGYEIWGLTAWVIAELLNSVFDAQIQTRPRPERT